MPFPRSSGILLHPTSFPSRFGIGDLGEAAYRFVDFLAESYQLYWQILPLGPTGFGNSPYLSYSAMAGNPMLISPDRLRSDQLLADWDFNHLPEFPADWVDFNQAIAVKMPLLQQACKTFKAQASVEQQQQFQEFCHEKAYWLEDYALFMAIKSAMDGKSWYQWEPNIAKRQTEALDKCRRQLTAEIFFQKFLQYQFFQQWSDLKRYANERGIQIIGDIPIYVAHDSADVWANPDIFCLDIKTGEPAGMAGVPPDYFSATGQLWGNPVYLWKRLEKQNFDWWVKRFQSMLSYVDIIRIDHFRGLESFWCVGQGETTAMNGKWIVAPGSALLKTVEERLGSLPIIAEDLGVITPEVEALRDEFEFPGMKILHFAFGSGPGNPYLPMNYYSRNCVVYTGTHDNDTTVGWFEKLSDHERWSLLSYLGPVSEEGIHWQLIRQALSSVANQALIPMQDLLGLGSDARMNTPGLAEGNWGWRYRGEVLTWDLRDRLKLLTETYSRRRY
ncbi:4-alpha-glucanotransferase [Phormidium pseudopriestleyi FRX01]|uniref:4-alpha-glucanotransferase n=1 Tax=Phormidium pseudopriestleyi FRX01 TaxID=1759528 RepID=A0ABS3FQ14_9CYAN|nr:4-alpha-glucanotransferase [Phormidium pseudopriestleyi]MBO0349210.1 4-alpha-glucanotransferase [Phormidium pseudopriestleyi FRX01]